MSRWLVLAAFSMALPLLGCGSSVRAGLSNAPRLGGTTTADNRVGDAVSNGDDACGAYAENGALRNRIPPCPGWAATYPLSGSEVPLPAAGAPGGSLVQPWLNHFYVGWPCPAATSSRQTKSWSSSPGSSSAVATCSVP
jgi:hypothetical protein